MKKVKLKVKILASMAIVSMTIAGGTLYVTNAKQHRNVDGNSIELNVEKQDRDTVKIYLSNFGDLAKSLQLSVKIDKGNVKFEKDSIKWLIGSENNDENGSNKIQTNYKIDSSGKVLDLFIVSKEALNSDGGRIELCEIDVSKDESILDRIFKSNDGTYTVVPNVVDGEAYSYVTYSTNKRVAGENIVNPSDEKLSIKDEPIIKFKDISSVVNNQIIISKGTVFNINDYVEAFDADGNEIEKIEYTGEIDNKKAGSYKIVCTATDSSGITTKLETVVVVEQITNEDISQPVIYGTETPIEIFIGEEFNLEEGITAKDYMGRNLKLNIYGEYDINTAGEYTIIYSATDRFNNTVTAERKLIVNEKIEEDDSKPDQPDNPGNNNPIVPDGSGDKDYTIPEIIESIVDKEVVTTISGNGTSTAPLLVEVKDVNSEQFVRFLNSIDEKGLEVKEGKVKEDDTYKTLTLKLGKKSLRTTSMVDENIENEYYMSVRVDKSKVELLNILNTYIEQNNLDIKDNNNDNNSNNGDSSNNGNTGDVNNNNSSSGSSNNNSSSDNNGSDNSGDKDFILPEVIESIIDKEVVTPISGEGTSEKPLLVEVKDISPVEFKEFLDNIDTLGIKETKVEEYDTYKVFTFKLGKKSARITRMFNSNRENEYYISIRIDKSKVELLNVMNNYIDNSNNNVGNNNNNSGDSSDLDNSAGDNNMPSQDITNNGEVSSESSSGGSFIDKITNTINNIFGGSNNSQESNNVISDDKINNNNSGNSEIKEQETDENNLAEASDADKDIEDKNATDIENANKKNDSHVLELQNDNEQSVKDKKIGLFVCSILTLCAAVASIFYFKNKKK